MISSIQGSQSCYVNSYLACKMMSIITILSNFNICLFIMTIDYYKPACLVILPRIPDVLTWYHGVCSELPVYWWMRSHLPTKKNN